MKRGWLYWAHLDKRRPVLVVSHDARNSRATDLIVVPLTTVLRPMPFHVLLRKREAGLLQDLMAKCEQVTTLRRSDLEADALGGPLSADRMTQVERALLLALGIRQQD